MAKGDSKNVGPAAKAPVSLAGTGVNGVHGASERPTYGNPDRPDAPPPTRPGPGSRVFNRDLSWLEFNRRVLELVVDERTPLLERVRFLSIFSSNLDEFVMKRLGALKRRIVRGLSAPEQDGLAAGVLFGAMRRTIHTLQRRQAETYQNAVRPALAREGIHVVAFESLDPGERKWIDRWYRTNAFPVLTPLSVDPGHRFPFISNLSRNLGILMTDPGSAVGSEPLFARVKIPTVLTQWIRLPGKDGAVSAAGNGRFVNLRDVIQNNLDDLFPGMQIQEVVPFRVTRDSEPKQVEDDDADNLLEQVEAQLRQRRFADAVRMEIGPGASDRMTSQLADELGLAPEDIDVREGLLDYTTLLEIADLPGVELHWPRWTPVVPRRLADRDRDIFSIIREGDVLVHHPFESFGASAERFIAEAARDPDVLAIKQTLYRTSRDSPFVSSLIRAAEGGKQVACLVELRARFDEQRNVRFAQMLERAGVHVAYGVVGLKTHCKAALVVRRESGGIRCYTHLGTGNYHPRTAQLYTDLGLFTCNPAITDDVVELFNLLTGRSRRDIFDTLLVAPLNMKSRFIGLIERETRIAREYAGGGAAVNGRIIAKMNAVADQDVTEKLYEASAAGAEVTLFIRGFCCLRPGVPGMSENIRVVSVVGRFLEHSRFFHFGGGKEDPLDGDWYISSADWMYRNLNNRVEAACPVLDRASRAQLDRIVQVMAADNRKAWDLRPDGSYVQRHPSKDAAANSAAVLGTFATLMREAAG